MHMLKPPVDNRLAPPSLPHDHQIAILIQIIHSRHVQLLNRQVLLWLLPILDVPA